MRLKILWLIRDRIYPTHMIAYPLAKPENPDNPTFPELSDKELYKLDSERESDFDELDKLFDELEAKKEEGKAKQ